MKTTDIYQTLEDRQNDEEVEDHGPYFCSERYANGILKSGTKEPWLGEGYYFWDTRIADARWWGDTVYSRKGYIICKTTYDQNSPLLYDLVGDIRQFDEFIDCAELIKKKLNLKTVKFPVVLAYMKKENVDFNYKAIRVWPHPNTFEKTPIRFPDAKVVWCKPDKIQICFFDKTLLTEPYRIVGKKAFTANQTI